MASPITLENLRYLAGLAHIELGSEEAKKLLIDLQKILDHFEELGELKTDNIGPMKGGTILESVFRDETERIRTNLGAGRDAFPEQENRFLKTPPVFE